MSNTVKASIESSFTTFLYAHLQGKTLVLQDGYGLNTIRVFIHRHETQGDWKESEIEEFKSNFRVLWNHLDILAQNDPKKSLDASPPAIRFEGLIDNSVVTFKVRARPDLKVASANSVVCELIGITPGRERKLATLVSDLGYHPSAMKAEIIEAQDFIRGGEMGDVCLVIHRIDERGYRTMVVFKVSEDTILTKKLILDWLTVNHQLYVHYGHRMDGYVFEIPSDDPEESPEKFRVEELNTSCLKRGMADSVQFFGVKPLEV